MSRLAWLSLFLLTACGPSGPAEPFHGEWRVASAITPGVSAVTAAGAAGQTGVLVSLQPGRARVGDRTCGGAVYTRRALSVQTFIEAYRVTPQQLSLTADPIPLVDVTCESGGLDLGSTLVVKSDREMLTMWDGAFYVLMRN